LAGLEAKIRDVVGLYLDPLRRPACCTSTRIPRSKLIRGELGSSWTKEE
jgi:hypothetical protein